MDIYLEMSFFDLQQNWHYLAYGAYAFFFFRAFNARNMSKNKMVLYTYLSAIGMSIFDETFQFFMSDRVFDISDITKDSLGVYCGLILVLFVTQTYGSLNLKEHSVYHQRLKDYFQDPLSLLVAEGVLTISFILISPLLTAHENIIHSLVGGFTLFVFVMLLIHLSQFRRVRFVILGIILLVILSLSASAIRNKDKNISHHQFGLTIYRGLPVPFFDFIIYPDGSFHLADKKHFFNTRDKDFLLRAEPDILLIGSGSQSKGGKGFDLAVGTYFIFNQFTMKGTQIIILPTPEACEQYNNLKKAGKDVLFVVHNTC
jgi:hypothetical protein